MTRLCRDARRVQRQRVASSSFSRRPLFSSPMRSRFAFVALSLAAVSLPAQPQPQRPFGTLREQADRQQQWLRHRLTNVLPALRRKHGIDMWVVPMREYNEDPVFTSLVSPTTFAARRRTIYVFFDRCAHGAAPNAAAGCVERVALGGTSQGGLYDAVRSTKAIDAAV